MTGLLGCASLSSMGFSHSNDPVTEVDAISVEVVVAVDEISLWIVFGFEGSMVKDEKCLQWNLWKGNVGLVLELLPCTLLLQSLATPISLVFYMCVVGGGQIVILQVETTRWLRGS